MRYFNYLSSEEEHSLFYIPPVPFYNTSDKEILSYSVGAALYMPATKSNIAEIIANGKIDGLVSVVLDLEDAVGDNQVEIAEKSLLEQIAKLVDFLETGKLSSEHLPLIFIRIRNVEQMKYLIARLEDHIKLITGFVFPKFIPEYGEAYFRVLEDHNHNRRSDLPMLYGLPILESASIIYHESRTHTLQTIKQILDHYKDMVLNVRIGATDFSSLFGLRRSPDMTVYDITPIRDCIAGIINLFGRTDSSYVLSGPVWEYFSNHERILKPQLRETLFEESLGVDGRKLRKEYIASYMDGLIREVIMDKQNGLIGKTVIHPSHIRPVQALYTVTHEEYMDATSIVSNNNGTYGVVKSEYSNKMNEIKPHLNWAKRILLRSQIYGVLHERQHFISLLPKHE
ncbi:HpcH/HpaI aldolase/citrate lyase family protein [Paenibacillus eucommiae]|uniref:Citrate lyase beta subunit n=1 Tax=Paenibacillus eucommiae TaxID=1355755 RepID=A0ABS4J2F0_9BACL|nr:HpcH/HpaI aldolase/citrate lyase family protein [Paenibacillus eucommiae]MBP1993490.1 citrate lyase beta subunit [Paenibacillus eucommiae]